MALDRGQSASPRVDAAARLLLLPGLRGLASPLLGEATWTVKNAQLLSTLVSGDNADLGDRSFLEKLRTQLRGQDDQVIVFAAEMLYVQVLPLANVRAETKVRRIEEILSWTNAGVELTPPLRDGLEAPGTFNGGAGFNIRIWQQLLWLCRFVKTWWSAMPEDRTAALSEPLAFRDLAGTTEGADETAMRLSLQALMWPGFFDSVVKQDHRRRIRNAFAHLIADTLEDEGDLDQQLFDIRRAVESGRGERVDWYLSPYIDEWYGNTAKHAANMSRRAWLVRPGQGGADLVHRWQADEFVSLPARNLELDLLSPDEASIRAAVDAGYGHLDYAQRLQMEQEDGAFILRMNAEDLVLGLADDRAILGVISGESNWGDAEDSRLRRSVDWLPDSVVRKDLAEPLPGLLDKQGGVVDLTTALDVLELLEQQLVPAKDEVIPAPEVVRSRASTPELPAATDDLAQHLHMPCEVLDEYLDLLQDRRQLVFYGPPGTGKTFLAEALGQHIVGNSTNHLVTVQFHPSYAYEDFFEGLRPDPSSDNAKFKLAPGPLRRLVAEATSESGEGHPFVLVIDEMNRANLAKVFGELYYLLEYRNQSITLQYSDESFSLPKNLFMIGTMNTLDRSISMVDAAIRRRFPFVELHPAVDPVAGVLPAFLAANGASHTRARLLAALNGRIAERDMQIGPSYLMKRGADTDKGLQRIWRYDILPLLEDHYYGTRSPEDIREQFGLEALLKEADPAAGRNGHESETEAVLANKDTGASG